MTYLELFFRKCILSFTHHVDNTSKEFFLFFIIFKIFEIWKHQRIPLIKTIKLLVSHIQPKIRDLGPVQICWFSRIDKKKDIFQFLKKLKKFCFHNLFLIQKKEKRNWHKNFNSILSSFLRKSIWSFEFFLIFLYKRWVNFTNFKLISSKNG